MSHTISQHDTPLRLDPARLQQIATQVYQSIGVPAPDAQLAADTLVQADLWGHQSHGLLRLGWYYARLKSGAMKAVTQTSLAVDAGAPAGDAAWSPALPAPRGEQAASRLAARPPVIRRRLTVMAVSSPMASGE